MADGTTRSSRSLRRWILIAAGALVVFVAGGVSVSRWVRVEPAAPAIDAPDPVRR
jgi:uncharacterized membrane protein